MPPIANDEALDILFRAGRSHDVWLDRPVRGTLLQAVWELAKFGPTTDNCSPARIVFVTTQAAKERLARGLAAPDVATTMAAPVTTIVGYCAGDAPPTQLAALRNGSLQAGYLVLAARALGLDCQLLADFDRDQVDAAFFPDGKVKSNFLCNLGYGDATQSAPRNPRLSFDEACTIL
jgi:3-hydroxypropanoate dehydrogenase